MYKVGDKVQFTKGVQRGHIGTITHMWDIMFRVDIPGIGWHVTDRSRVRRFPVVVCLCGSTRFSDAYQQANLDEALAGNIVLTIGCDMRSDAQIFTDKTESELADIKANLDELHLRKIDMADEVLILNVDGYVGESTRREWQYAKEQGKVIRWLEPDKIPPTQ